MRHFLCRWHSCPACLQAQHIPHSRLLVLYRPLRPSDKTLQRRTYCHDQLWPWQAFYTSAQGQQGRLSDLLRQAGCIRYVCEDVQNLNGA